MATKNSNRKQKQQQQQQQNQAVGACGNQFFKVLLPDFLKKLYMPPAFGKTISKRKHRDATIRGPLGKSWPVKVHEDSKGLYFGQGWRDFAIARDLSVGCFLVFKYEGRMDFSVTVFDVSACEKVYGRKRSFNNIIDIASCSSGVRLNAGQHPKATTCERKQAASSVSKAGGRQQPHVLRSRSKLGPHFKATMKRCYLNQRRPYMNIPVIFRASYDLASKYQVILRDPEGVRWPVKIYHQRKNRQIYCAFGHGWEEFYGNNDLKEGDSCIFEVAQEEENDIMDVHIFRK